MSLGSNQPELARIRTLMESVRLSAEELLSGKKTQEHNQPELVELVQWLQQSSANQALYDSLRQMDQAIEEEVRHTPDLTPGFVEELKAAVMAADRFDNADDKKTIQPDYESWFAELDGASDSNATHQNAIAEGANSGSEGVSLSESSRSPEDNTQKVMSARGLTRPQWWATGATVLGTVAVSLLLFVMMRPDVPTQPAAPTAEMLCKEALEWNPNGNNESSWNHDLAQAPANRLFPNHLIRLQARSWKTMKIAGDSEGVVYNLIPEGNLSELKAYVYVFRSDQEMDLPGQFSSHSVANRKYRFWSVACQQDLVFVLVFEGDEKRLGELVKMQQVG